MTEDEAKKKWCPFGTVIAFNHQRVMLPVAINRTRGLGEQPTCLASGCSAWIPDRAQPQHGQCGIIASRSATRT